MSNSISKIMQKNVVVANVDDSISEVEAFITEHKLSFLPVVDSTNKCFGVICDYDILKFHNEKGNSKLEHAWEICSHSVINVSDDISIKDAAELLIEKRVHHLVISNNDKIIGVVSSIDLLRYYLEKELLVS